jgi:hypothetical protein
MLNLGAIFASFCIEKKVELLKEQWQENCIENENNRDGFCGVPQAALDSHLCQ